MANRTFLISTDSLEKPPETQDKILCAASYMIPIFWFMLFDRDAIVDATVDWGNEDQFHYPYLSKAYADAIAMAKTRWPNVRRVIGSHRDGLFRQWLEFLEARPGGYLQCDTAELWAMYDDTPSFMREMELCLGAFSDSREVDKSPGWQALLSQAAWDEETQPSAAAYSFCGYAWIDKVPWSVE